MKKFIIFIPFFIMFNLFSETADKTVLYKIDSKFKLENEKIELLETILETELTSMGYGIISKKVQKDILKEQYEQRINDCYDNECLVKTGKMVAARKLITIKVKKNGKNTLFTIKKIDIETGIIENTKIDQYQGDLSEFSKINPFLSKLIKNVFNNIEKEGKVNIKVKNKDSKIEKKSYNLKRDRDKDRVFNRNKRGKNKNLDKKKGKKGVKKNLNSFFKDKKGKNIKQNYKLFAIEPIFEYKIFNKTDSVENQFWATGGKLHFYTLMSKNIDISLVSIGFLIGKENKVGLLSIFDADIKYSQYIFYGINLCGIMNEAQLIWEDDTEILYGALIGFKMGFLIPLSKNSVLKIYSKWDLIYYKESDSTTSDAKGSLFTFGISFRYNFVKW